MCGCCGLFCKNEWASGANALVGNAFEDLQSGEKVKSINWVEALGGSILPCLEGRLKILAIFRCLAALFLVSFMVYLPIDDVRVFSWFLTNWTFFLETVLFLILGYISVNAAFLPERLNSDKPPRYAKVAVVLHSIVVPAAFVVSAMFWTVLFNYTRLPSAIEFATHGVNIVLILIDYFVNSVPMRSTWVWMAVLYGVLFSTWSVIHSFTGLENNYPPCLDTKAQANVTAEEIVESCQYIYDILNWNAIPMVAAIVSGGLSFIVMPLLFIMFWFIKNFGVARCSRKNMEPIEDPVEDSLDPLQL